MRRPAVLFALVSALILVLRRRTQVARSDKDVWTEATSPPDLR